MTVDQNLIGGAVMLSTLRNTYITSQGPLCENTTSSAKPEKHNVTQRCQTEEDGATATVTGEVPPCSFRDIGERRDKQTHSSQDFVNGGNPTIHNVIRKT